MTIQSSVQIGDFARVGNYENDIATLLYYYQPVTTTLPDKISKYVNETDLEEINGVVSEIQKRISLIENFSYDN